jgi:hypothetical protein
MKDTDSKTSTSKYANWKGERCRATARSGEQCKRPSLPGLKVCRFHGGKSPRAAAVADKARLEEKIHVELSRMERLTGLIPEDDPEARGDVALVTEIRRTVNRIRILDEWIQELGERSLGWGIAKRVRKSGLDADKIVEFDEKTFETRMNVYYSIQLEERKHLAQLAKVWIAAGFKARELDLQERQVMAFNSALLELCAALGHDPADGAVKAVVHRVMMGLAQPALEGS